MWEYHAITIYSEHPKDIEDILDEKGQDGWELVTVTPTVRDEPVLMYVFKRPLRLPSVYIDPDLL